MQSDAGGRYSPQYTVLPALLCALFRYRREPVFPFRHQDLEPGPLAVYSRLLDGKPRDGEDLAGEEKPEAGVLAKPFLEDPLFVLLVHSDPVVLVYKGKVIEAVPGGGKRDVPDPFPMAEGVIDEVLKDFLEEGIGIDLEPANVD